MILDVGQTVDRYRIEAVLGEGGMAVVYRVVHTELGTKHAMKVLQLTTQSIRERMLQEGRIQATLRHENIVAVTDVIRVQGVPALVMEYVAGPPLDHFLFRCEPSFAQVDDLVQGILAGVGHAHDQGMIHRDLKLANVLLSVQGQSVVPKIADFGLAKLLGPGGSLGSATRTGVAMGTPTFMPPEQYRNAKDVDHRADLYAVGAMAYQLVTGRPAYTGDDLIELHQACAAERYIPVHDIKPDVPPRMENAIRAALRAKPEDRPQSAHQMRQIWRGEAQGRKWSSLLAPEEELWPSDRRALIRKMAPEKSDRAVNVKAGEAPPKEPAKPTLAPRSSHTSTAGGGAGLLVVGGALAFFAVLLVGGAGLGIAVAMGVFSDEPQSIQVDPTLVDDAAPPRTEDDEAPVAEGSSDEEATGDEATTTTEEPASDEATSDEEIFEEPADEGPAPKASDRPRPIAAAPVPPEVEPVETEGPAPDKGIVRVSGVDRAYLVDTDGTRLEPGVEIAPGTYQLKAFLEPGKATDMMEVDVAPGTITRISCNPQMRLCSKK